MYKPVSPDYLLIGMSHVRFLSMVRLLRRTKYHSAQKVNIVFTNIFTENETEDNSYENYWSN